MDNKGLMYPAYHRFYGALQNLEKFSIEKELIDNIVCLDDFFSAFRSTSFVLQSSLAHTEFLPMYKELCEQYLKKNSVCRWIVETRNEIEKQHPIDLQKEIYVTVYSPVSSTILHSDVFNIANDVGYRSIVDALKKYLIQLNMVEVHLSLEFMFKKVDDDVNLFEDIKMAISIMRDFLFAVDDRIGSTTEICEELKIRIDDLIAKLSMTEAFFIEDYVFYSDGGRFVRGERVLSQLREEPVSVIELLKSYGARYPSTDPKEFMKIMARFHLLIYRKQENHLMPAIFIVYANNTCRVISFDATIRTTTYRKINEIAARVIPDNIKYVTLIHAAYLYKDFSTHLLPYDKRIEHSTGEAIMVLQIGDGFVPRMMEFDTSRIKDVQYVDDILKEHNNETFIIQCSILYPIYLEIMKKRAQRRTK